MRARAARKASAASCLARVSRPASAAVGPLPLLRGRCACHRLHHCVGACVSCMSINSSDLSFQDSSVGDWSPDGPQCRARKLVATRCNSFRQGPRISAASLACPACLQGSLLQHHPVSVSARPLRGCSLQHPHFPLFAPKKRGPARCYRS